MGASWETRLGGNILVLFIVLGTSILGLMAIYDHDYDVAVLDTSLNTIIARTDKEASVSFSATGVHKDDAAALAAYACVTAGTGCALGANNAGGIPAAATAIATALQANLKLILEARIKREYQLTPSGLVWNGVVGTDGKRPELHEPKNTIDFQFDNLNDGWTGCSERNTNIFSPFGSLSPADVDFGSRCNGDERLHGNSKDACKDSWLYLLYDPKDDGGPMGIEIDDKWVSKICEYQKDTWKITAGFFIASIALQFVYYVYWAIYTGMGKNTDITDGNLMFMKVVAGLLVITLCVTLGLFATSRHKLLSEDYNDGLHDATNVVMDDDIAIADFPARAKMYKDAFALCYGSDAAVVDADGTAPTGNGCAAFADFKTAITALGLDDAGKCAFDGDESITFENPEDACNLPKTFANYKSIKKDGPEFTITDKREFDISSTERSLEIIEIDRDAYAVHGIIIAGLVLWLIKELLLVLELYDNDFVFINILFPCCPNILMQGGSNYAVAGGYAGAV